MLCACLRTHSHAFMFVWILCFWQLAHALSCMHMHTHTHTHTHTHSQAEAFPALAPVIPLLPEDFLVTYTDVVPGLRRFDGEGQLSISTKQCISTLARPVMSPIHR